MGSHTLLAKKSIPSKRKCIASQWSTVYLLLRKVPLLRIWGNELRTLKGAAHI